MVTDGIELTYIVDWYTSHSQLIETLLSTSGVTYNLTTTKLRWQYVTSYDIIV